MTRLSLGFSVWVSASAPLWWPMGVQNEFSPVWFQWHRTAFVVCELQNGILEVSCQFPGVRFLTVTMQAPFPSHQRSVVVQLAWLKSCENGQFKYPSSHNCSVKCVHKDHMMHVQASFYPALTCVVSYVLHEPEKAEVFREKLLPFDQA